MVYWGETFFLRPGLPAKKLRFPSRQTGSIQLTVNYNNLLSPQYALF